MATTHTPAPWPIMHIAATAANPVTHATRAPHAARRNGYGRGRVAPVAPVLAQFLAVTPDEIVAAIDALGPVDPAARVALRNAVAGLSLIEYRTPAPVIPTERTYWRTTEVATALRVTPATVRALIARGDLDGQRIGSAPGSPWIITAASLDAYTARRPA